MSACMHAGKSHIAQVAAAITVMSAQLSGTFLYIMHAGMVLAAAALGDSVMCHMRLHMGLRLRQRGTHMATQRALFA